MSTLAERINKRMEELDMHQADLARETGLTTATIAYIVNDKNVHRSWQDSRYHKTRRMSGH